MELDLLDAHQADQLSACSLSLLLGVYTQDNKIEKYLRIARAILNVENAIFTFHDEPYFWMATEQYDFKGVKTLNKKRLTPYFEKSLIVTEEHSHYQYFSDYLHSQGIHHKRLLCYDFKTDTGESVGQITFFDDSTTAFTPRQMFLLEELTSGLITILQKRSESENYHELYEQERVLNFSKTKFFQIIAHDLRAPFHGLIGFSDVLVNERETLDEAGIQDIACYLHDTLQSTYSLLENLLNWAMAEGGRFVYHPINFKLKQSTKIVVDVLNSLAIKKNIELVEDIAENLSVFADMNMVTSVIQNLVSNALKFTNTDGSGRVVISARQIDQCIEISIHDTGLGMTESQMETIFEPQINVSFKGTKGEKGTGLGLVLCKRFVDLNHGKISVTSQKGLGTTFKVILPATQDFHKTLILDSAKPQMRLS